MASNHLEELVAQWYEWRGYFVRRNVLVGKLAKGGHECELDIIAFNPALNHLLQIEPSLDADSWAKREIRYRKKFIAGRKHIPKLFPGLNIPTKIDQVAIFLFGSQTTRSQIGGGRILSFNKFMNDILNTVSGRALANAMIPEQFDLLRTLQFAARTWPVNHS